jgi:hypothetical protein
MNGDLMSHPDPVTSDRLAIRLKSIAMTHGGEVGWVDKVMVEPMSWHAHALIVAGPPPQGQITVPIQAVFSADGTVTRMELGSKTPLGTLDVPGHPPSHAGTVRPMAKTRRAVRGAAVDASGLAPLSAAQSVICRGGAVGHIDLVLVDTRTSSATHLVVRCSDARRPDARIPLWWTAQITPERLVIDASWDQIDSCPGYRPDDEISEDVRAAVQQLAALDPRDFWPLDVRTRDGIVELSGMPQTGWVREMLQRLTRGLKGVVDVRDGGDRSQTELAAGHGNSRSGPSSDEANIWTRASPPPPSPRIGMRATGPGKTWSPSA